MRIYSSTNPKGGSYHIEKGHLSVQKQVSTYSFKYGIVVVVPIKTTNSTRVTYIERYGIAATGGDILNKICRFIEDHIICVI